MSKWIAAFAFAAALVVGTQAQAQTVQGQVVVGGTQAQGQVVVQGGMQAPPPQQPQQQVYYQQPQPQQQVIYQQPMMPQQQMVTETVWQPMWGLIVPGIVMLAASYVLHAIVNSVVSLVSAAAASISTNPWAQRVADSYGWGFIPAIGPFIQAGIVGDSLDDGWGGWLFAMGLIQTLGLVGIVIGATVGHTVTVTRVADNGDLDEDAQAINLEIAPWVDGTTGGMRLGLSF